MARAPSHQISDPSSLQPVATPVDTFTTTAQAAPSPLGQLAEGLAGFDRGLTSFMAKRTAKQQKLDAERGRMAALRGTSEGQAEAVREGLIPADASPAFIEAAATERGNLQGIRLRSQARLEYQQWTGRNTASPQGYAEFLQDFIRKNVPEDTDPYVLAGMNPHIGAMFDEGYSQLTQERAKATYEGAVSTHGAVLTEALDEGGITGNELEGGTDYEALWSLTLQQREKALSTGIREQDFDALAVDSIIAQAVKTNNTDLLKLLDRTIPGQQHALSSFPDFRDAKAKAEDSIDLAKRQLVTGDRQQRKDKEEAREKELYGTISRQLAADHRTEIPEETLQELDRYDPIARVKVIDMRKKLAEADGIEDEGDILKVFEAVRNGATESDINALLRNGVIRSSETYNKALDRLDKYRKAKQEGSGILSSATSKRYLTMLKNATEADGFDPMGVKGLSDEGLQATQDFELMLMQWDEKNTDAGLMDREKAINEIGNVIRERIKPNETTGTGEYVSPEDIKVQPQSPISSTTPPVGELLSPAVQLPEATTQESDPTPSIEPQRTMPALESLPPKQQSVINEGAKKRGLAPEDYQRAIWEKMEAKRRQLDSSQQHPGIDPTTTNAIPADVRDRLQGLLSNPPQIKQLKASGDAAGILNLIGTTEGTDRGRGYNETLGYGAYTGGNVELTSMSLDQVDQLQTGMLAHEDNRWNSSALGRYQIIRTTLRDIKEEMGLDGSEKFTRELQDEMAMHLLERRGYRRWKAGQMSDQRFINNLAKEWASLPTAAGKGAYKGQRAAATPAKVLAALSDH